jgi:hypothetical protein
VSFGKKKAKKPEHGIRKSEKRKGGKTKGRDTNSVDRDELLEAALEDLKRSSLTEKDFRKLQLEVLSRDETDSYVGEPRSSYRIPYFDFSGKKISYSRVRFLESKKGGFTKKGGSFRYSQPSNSSPHVYLAPYLNWKKVAGDIEQKILITEGEKKAALACKLGIPCIALGGVYGYKSQKRLWDLIPELTQFKWADREVEICYDADVMLKSEVRDALTGLALTLTKEYSPKSISFVMLDAETAGPKTGLDDYLIEHGAEAFADLPRQEYRANSRINALNDKICYVEDEMRFFDIKARKFFRSFYHARETFMNEGEEMIGPKQTALVIDLWGKSQHRRSVKSVIYEPGAPEMTEDNDMNLWKPTVVRPKKQKPAMWLDLVHYIFRKPEYVEWFLKWLAYPVQHPGAKLFQAVFVYGAKQGIGKTFAVDPVMEYIYGKENFKRLKNASLNGVYNTYAGRSQMVVTNEIYLSDFADRKALMGAVNDMITRDTVSVNEKFQPEVDYVDHCNYYFTSNHSDALIIDKNDRRIFVIEAPTEKLDQTVYDELDEYVRRGDGPAHILHYLLNEVDVGDFNPKADVMKTEWKAGLVGLGKDQLGEFVDRVRTDAEMLMMVDGHLPDLHLYRAEDLLRLFERLYPKYRFNVTIQRLGRMLNDANIERRQVRVSATSKAMWLYCLFNKDKWDSKKNREWAEHYTTHAKKFGGKVRT